MQIIKGRNTTWALLAILAAAHKNIPSLPVSILLPRSDSRRSLFTALISPQRNTKNSQKVRFPQFKTHLNNLFTFHDMDGLICVGLALWYSNIGYFLRNHFAVKLPKMFVLVLFYRNTPGIWVRNQPLDWLPTWLGKSGKTRSENWQETSVFRVFATKFYRKVTAESIKDCTWV